ncbi:DUF305 domain-containing protein [uncultured Phycicoccus sp.]|uniref:DUF305 domain-containing protein n=1 Tax=uncultured Phycicoccus sp. TaxID=661422 RepID=UPI00262D7B76|nr:DUF305 domain-containing protein [uncultured Phycicoccus sp.]
MPIHRPSTRRRRAGAALVAGVAALLTGCSGGDAAPAVTASAGSVPVLQPGSPGEPNTTLTGPAATPVVSASASPEDTRFLQDMIAHHAQAIVMVDTAGNRFSDTQVASLASRIRDEQGPEIAAMAGWLEARGQDVPPEAANPRLADHGAHAGMPGMASETQLAHLAQARGSDVDRLFLALMIAHHEGALTMVDEHAKGAADERVEELAAEITATQSKQIGQMNDMLERLT